MTVDEVFADLRARFGADVEEALAWQAGDGGELVFAVGIDRKAKNELEVAARAEAMDPKNLLARIEALEATKVER